jgi:hypothetical protein
MKFSFLKSSLAIGLLLCIAATSAVYETKNNTAEVIQNNGLYIFTHCTPVKEFEYLGSVNMPEVVWSGKTGEMINIAVRRANKQFPDAQGIILKSENLTMVEAIKFK